MQAIILSALWLNMAALIALTLTFFLLHRVLRKRDLKNWRVALITFGGLPLLMWALASCAWLSGSPITVARVAFIYAVVLLPPSLFFLFIATRRESLFNNYAANLNRLGLLSKRRLRLTVDGETRFHVEDDINLRRRIKGYLDRFGAVYGTLPDTAIRNFILSVMKGRDADPDGATGELPATFDAKTILPVFGASTLIALGWLMVLPPYPAVEPSQSLKAIEAALNLQPSVWYLWAAEPLLVPASFAFLGAYFFSLQMLVKRFVRRDLGPNAYNAVSMRIILATLGVWVAYQCLEFYGSKIDPGLLLAVSFVVGAFPIIVWQLLANALKRLPGTFIVLPNLYGTLPLSKVDGLSVWHEARLDEEDIENVPNLATADIVDLMLNTKVSPNRIIDWVDQAILLMKLPDDQRTDGGVAATLIGHGIRTASGLVAATKSSKEHPAIVDLFQEELRGRVLALAAMVQLCPNFPLVQTWLAAEPWFPSDAENNIVDVARALMPMAANAAE